MTSLGRACVGMSARETSFPYFAFWVVRKLEVMQDFVSLISNVGFPIFACIMIYKAMEKEREDHKQESDKWVEALNNNTNVMKTLISKLEGK